MGTVQNVDTAGDLMLSHEAVPEMRQSVSDILRNFSCQLVASPVIFSEPSTDCTENTCLFGC